jgi:succinate dehydrogenase flavin-adding protein (antitoxin of CptAB toxin-antitoxin module)
LIFAANKVLTQMTKKLFVPLLACIALFGCNNDKDKEKALLNDVIKTHDKLMADDGAIMKNKMQLKSIAAKDTSTVVKDSVATYTKLLNDADNSMMMWMDKFSPDFTGKTHEQIMTYLNTQKAEVIKLDTTMVIAISASNNYIIKAKTK